MANLILERKVNSGSYSVIATLPYPTESFTDSNALVNGNTYYYRARVLDGTTYSEYSTEMSIVYSNIMGETNLTGEGILVVLATTYKIVTASTTLTGQLNGSVTASRYLPHYGVVNLTESMTNNVVPLIVKVASTDIVGTNALNVLPTLTKYGNINLIAQSELEVIGQNILPSPTLSGEFNAGVITLNWTA